MHCRLVVRPVRRPGAACKPWDALARGEADVTVSPRIPSSPGILAPAGFDALAGMAMPILIAESSHPGLVDRVLLNAAAYAQFLGLPANGRWFSVDPQDLADVGLDVQPWTARSWAAEPASLSKDHQIGPDGARAWWRLSFSPVNLASPLRLLVSACLIDDLRPETDAEEVDGRALIDEVERMAGFGHYAFWPQQRRGVWTNGMARTWTVPEAHSQREFEKMVALIHPTDLQSKAQDGERDTVLTDSNEVRVVRADGEVRYVRSIGSRHIDAQGRVERVVRVDQDVTELRRTEEELRLAREAASDAARAKEAFLHLMNHSLRTPLNAILGFGEAMRDQIYGPLSADYAQSIEAVNDSALRLLELVDDILDLTRLESGRYSLAKTVCDVDLIVREVVDLMAPRVTERNLRLCAAAPEGESITLWGEERGLRQILVNLLEFATRSGRDVHTITIGARTADEGHAMLWLEDDGAGLEPEIERAIADPLGRGLNASEATGASSWFGLSLVKSFLQLHGGTLHGATTPAGTFRIEVILPR